MSKVLIDRNVLERAVYGLELAYETDTPTVRDICAVLSAPSGTPAMPVKAYYHEAVNAGIRTKSVGLEVRKEFADAPLVLESDALARIACLEGEIAKRDARIMGLESQYQRGVYGLNNEGDPIGGDPAGGYANDNARLRAELAAIKAQDTVGEVVGWYRLDRPYEMTPYPSVCATWHRLGAPVAPLYAAHAQQVSVPAWMASSRAFADRLYMAGWRDHADAQHSGVAGMYGELLAAAPAAPAADAGIVDMYRHLQKVTPYRFKKIQDASITDGGDVMYFHKDRFDAALLADMAAHCAAKGVL